MKKSLLVVLALLLLIVVAGCGGKKTFEKDFLGSMEVMKTNGSKVMAANKVEFDRTKTVSHGNGIFVTTNEDETKEVYSVAANKKIVTASKEETIELMIKTYINYVCVTKTITDDEGKKTNTFKLYDVLGNLVHEDKENFKVSTLVVSQVKDKDSDIDLIEETISYTKVSEEKVNAVYVIKEDGNRTTQNTSYNSVFDYLLGDESMKLKMKAIGLGGYLLIPITTTSSSMGFSIYKESSRKLVNTIILDMTEKELLFMCSGKMYYSVTKMLPEDVQEYDYLVEDKSATSYKDTSIKYKYDLYSLDLLSGKEEEVKTDFIIKDVSYEAAELIAGETRPFKYFPATIQRIDENKLLKAEENVVLDDKKNIVFSSNLFNVSSLKKLSYDRYLANTLTSGVNVLLDGKLNVLCPLNNLIVDAENKLIYCKLIDNKYGAIDYEMNIKLNFEYDSLLSNVIDGRIVLSKDSKTYVINKGNVEKTLSKDEKYVANTKVIETTNQETNKVTYTTLAGVELFTVAKDITVTHKAITTLDKEFAYITYIADGKLVVYPFEVLNEKK